MEIMLWLLAGHFIGDFPFQFQWMASEKGKSWEVNFYHAAVYTFTVFVLAAIGGLILSLITIGAILVSHFFIDAMKARWGLIKYIWLDQLLHLAVLAIIAVISLYF